MIGRWYNEARSIRLVRDERGRFMIETAPDHAGETLTRDELRELRELITRALAEDNS